MYCPNCDRRYLASIKERIAAAMDLEAGQADAPHIQQAIRRGALCSARRAPVCVAVAALVAIALFGLWYRAHLPHGLLWRDPQQPSPAPAPPYRVLS